MTKKKKGGIAAGAAAIFTAAVLALFGISGETVIEVDYSIEEDANLAEMTVSPPDEMSTDIVELYCNGEKVTTALLPSGKLSSIPFVFSDLENLEIRFYTLGECVAVGNFKGDKLYAAVKDGVLPDDYPKIDVEEAESDEE